MGAMMPCFIMTRGLTASWKDSLVIHSGPMGRRRERSYWARDSKGWGSWEARYLSFCIGGDESVTSLSSGYGRTMKRETVEEEEGHE